MKTLTALVTLAAVGIATAASAEIRIGATISETGPAAFLGDPEAKTLKMLVDKVNAAGGINGEEIALTLYDDGGDPNKARTFATRLVEARGGSAADIEAELQRYREAMVVETGRTLGPC